VKKPKTHNTDQQEINKPQAHANSKNCAFIEEAILTTSSSSLIDESS
jgi:hypothetical protein